ncbi:hypothetical protein AVEN_159633-1 [Araneus ventricosus]|uniref:Uncharacterized protein n=1 Tax=Araneus ventricosus TaxID=182803 RepID=A0A4Y1ZVC2_ARAVE|nr:hypothetical protein AVEN_159633-1 [Araneus ventricosus]
MTNMAKKIIKILNFGQGRGGLLVRSRLWGRRAPGSKPNSTEDPPCMGPGAPQIIRSGQTPSVVARPTQEGCKARRGPAGREPLHQHVEDRDLFGSHTTIIVPSAWRESAYLYDSLLSVNTRWGCVSINKSRRENILAGYSSNRPRIYNICAF